MSDWSHAGRRAPRVLILAGTAEARRLCAAVAELPVLASLAGVTETPASLGVPTRVGGFGGEAGFRAVLDGIRGVLDATHPFAAQISSRSQRICRELGVPYLRLTRPPWDVPPHWRCHATVEDAAVALPAGARAFLTVGPGSLPPFEGRDLGIWCRRVDPAPERAGVHWIIGTPPFSVEEECALMEQHGITDLVTKNAGGSRAKLVAADQLGVSVHVIDRPAPTGGPETHDMAEAIDFVRHHAAD